MANYTQSQIDAISNFSVIAYYNNINLGVLPAGTVTVKTVKSMTGFGSSLTGDNGYIGVINDGSYGVVTMELQNLSKHTLKALSGYDTQQGSTATNVSTPWVGANLGKSMPSIETGLPLVLRAITRNRNASTDLDDNASNPLSWLFPKAVLTSDLEIALASNEITKISLEFMCLNDPTQTIPSWYFWDDGITSAGIYTP